MRVALNEPKKIESDKAIPELFNKILNDLEKNMKCFTNAYRAHLVDEYYYDVPGLIDFAKYYYKKHPPIDANAWIRVYDPLESNLPSRQINFISYEINPLLHPSYEKRKENVPLVIASSEGHYDLPICQISNMEYGIEMVLGQYFHGAHAHETWEVSVKSEKPLDIKYITRMFPSLKKPKRPFYGNGFPEDKIYGTYSLDHSQFSFEVKSDYELYTFVSMVKAYLQIK